MNIIFSVLFIVMISMVCNSGDKQSMQTTPIGSESSFELPEGFNINIYAKVDNARAMALGEDGTVYVGSRNAGKVVALRDSDQDGIADFQAMVDQGLNMPVGVAIRNNTLYVSAVNKIFRYPDIANSISNPKRELVSDAFPDKSSHGWKFIDFGPDGKLYVPVGAPCNICDEDPMIFANIMRMNADGSELEVYAIGVRNTVGFDWHPITGELWFTDNGRDWLGDDLPPCELNCAPKSGMHFGFPYCHGKNVSDPKYGNERSCSEFIKPKWEFKAHTAPLGMCFYKGDMFPPSYKNKAFVALHGSWNRSTKIGYEVKLISFEDDHKTVRSSETFLGGLLNKGNVLGRPVDILELKDGSILISDDHSDKIYRVSYKK
ncbi:MAG: sorbosone dehydrogenase family protein [Chitinophagales bacterium]|nr:sorbosone dehydrogenase family protein [Chitinophagales bacterium]